MDSQEELLPEETVTFTCVNPSMCLLLNDNASSVKFDKGVFVAKGDKQIAAIREAITNSGYKSRFNVASKEAAALVIAQHMANQKAAGIKGAVGSQSDHVKGPGARLLAEDAMKKAGVDLETDEAKAVLNAIAPVPDQPVGDGSLSTEAAGIAALAESLAAKTKESPESLASAASETKPESEVKEPGPDLSGKEPGAPAKSFFAKK